MELPWGYISGLLKAGTFFKVTVPVRVILSHGHHRISKDTREFFFSLLVRCELIKADVSSQR